MTPDTRTTENPEPPGCNCRTTWDWQQRIRGARADTEPRTTLDDLIRAARDWGMEEASHFSLPSTLEAHRKEVEDIRSAIEAEAAQEAAPRWTTDPDPFADTEPDHFGTCVDCDHLWTLHGEAGCRKDGCVCTERYIEGAAPRHQPIKRIRNRQAEERCIVDDEFWPCRNVTEGAAPRAEGLDGGQIADVFVRLGIDVILPPGFGELLPWDRIAAELNALSLRSPESDEAR